jgi:hypothetical protein
MTSTAIRHDDGVVSTPVSPSAGPGASVDQVLACVLRQALRTLAMHSPSYAAVFSSRPGVRLAGHIVAGLVETTTQEGRSSMQKALDQVRMATTVEAGLDTNELMDRVTGRCELRRDQPAVRPTVSQPA